MSEKIKIKSGLEHFNRAITGLRYPSDSLTVFRKHPNKAVVHEILFFEDKDFELIRDLFEELKSYGIDIAEYKIVKRSITGEDVRSGIAYIIGHKIKGQNFE